MKNENYTSYLGKYMYMYKVWYMKHENIIKQNSLSKNKKNSTRLWQNIFMKKKKNMHFIIYIYYVHKHK